jgi:hypothetical protein
VQAVKAVLEKSTINYKAGDTTRAATNVLGEQGGRHSSCYPQSSHNRQQQHPQQHLPDPGPQQCPCWLVHAGSQCLAQLGAHLAAVLMNWAPPLREASGHLAPEMLVAGAAGLPT